MYFPFHTPAGGRGGMEGCSSVGRSVDRHAAYAGSILRCSQGFFSQGHLTAQTLLRVSVHLRVQSHGLTSMCTLKIPESMLEFG